MNNRFSKRLARRIVFVALLAVAIVSGAAVALAGSDGENGERVGICHATDSLTRPFIYIEVDAEDVENHERHEQGQDIIGVDSPADCPAGDSEAPGRIIDDSEAPGGVWICHSTSSPVKPYVLIRVGADAIDDDADGHSSHEHDIISPTDVNADGLLTVDDCVRGAD